MKCVGNIFKTPLFSTASIVRLKRRKKKTSLYFFATLLLTGLSSRQLESSRGRLGYQFWSNSSSHKKKIIISNQTTDSQVYFSFFIKKARFILSVTKSMKLPNLCDFTASFANDTTNIFVRNCYFLSLCCSRSFFIIRPS